MRILGLDYGEKTVGVAVSDPFFLFAQGLETIRRPDEKSIRKTINRLSQIIEEFEIDEIVLGYPKNMNNTISLRCLKVDDFKKRLETVFGLPVQLFDERLSTVGALASIKDAKSNAEIDTLAAVYILQGYLDMKNKAKEIIKMGSFDDNDEEDLQILTTYDEEGNPIEVIVLEFATYNGSNYLLVSEAEEYEDSDSVEVFVLKEVADENGTLTYQEIEDDEEFDAVSALFDIKED